MNEQWDLQQTSSSNIQAMARRRSAAKQRGGAYVEMALATIFLFVPLLVGLVVIGLATINRVQLEQITRDVGIMHARGVDFTLAQNKLLFNKLTQGSTFVGGGGGDTPSFNGTMVISTVRKLGASDCVGGCSNLGYPVVTYRVVLGNAQLYSSWLANPASITAAGKVNDFRNDGRARAASIENLMPTMLEGEEAYVAEGFMITPGISFPDINADTRVSTWAIF